MDHNSRSDRSSRTERTERTGRDSSRREPEPEGRERTERPVRGTERTTRRSLFQYQKPTVESVKERAEQRGGADFDSIFAQGTKVFKVNDGDNCIRILPPTWENAKHFGYDVFVHYGVGPDSQAYLCAKEMKTGDCPICEQRAKAVKQGDEAYAKELKPSKRVLIYLIDRDNEKEGVLAWAAPWTVDRDINSLIVDKRSGEVLGIDDPENGYDIEFTRKGKGMKTEYIGMQVARRESELGEQDWLEYAEDKPVPEILQFYDYDHILNVFNGQSSKPADGDDSGDELDRKQARDLDRSQARKSSRDSATPTWEDVHGMTYEELCSMIEQEQLDIKPKDSADDEELADWICDDLKITKKESRTERTTRSDPAKETESPRERMNKMGATRKRIE